MNLADYLSELLGQHDEVSVPGLGYFVRERINGYYNDKDAKFYPPCHKVKFVPQPKEDDTFTQYVADKKNISLASSKYFAEKFIGKLREQASTGKYTFADLGIFQTEQEQLVFKPYDKIAVDPVFYGYPPVEISKLTRPHGGNIKSAYAEGPAVVAVPAPISDPYEEQQEYFEEEVESRKSISVWLIILIVIAALALALAGIYKFAPATFDKINTTYHKIIGKKQDTIVPVYRHEINTDTIKKITPHTDSAAKTTAGLPTAANTAPTNVVDTTAPRYEIIAQRCKTLKLAKDAVKKYKDKGIEVKILTKAEAPGPYTKISAGTYSDQSKAEAVKLDLINQKKIPADAYTTEIKPKK